MTWAGKDVREGEKDGWSQIDGVRIPHSDGGHQDGDRRNGVGAGWRGDSGVEEARWINSGGGVTVWRDAAQWEGGAEPGTIILGREEKNHTDNILSFLSCFCNMCWIEILSNLDEKEWKLWGFTMLGPFLGGTTIATILLTLGKISLMCYFSSASKCNF